MKMLLNVPMLAFFLMVAASPCFADLMLFEIRSPKDCPEGLSIQSKASDGMMAFDVAIDPEAIAHAGELYKGRVGANGFLKIANAGQEIRVRELAWSGGGQERRGAG